MRPRRKASEDLRVQARADVPQPPSMRPRRKASEDVRGSLGLSPPFFSFNEAEAQGLGRRRGSLGSDDSIGNLQ